MSFRSPQSLLRTPLAAFRPPAATLGLPSSFQVRAASAAPSQAEQALSSALEDVKESSAIQALTEDVDAQKTLKDMSAFMESKGAWTVLESWGRQGRVERVGDSFIITLPSCQDTLSPLLPLTYSPSRDWYPSSFFSVPTTLHSLGSFRVVRHHPF